MPNPIRHALAVLALAVIAAASPDKQNLDALTASVAEHHQRFSRPISQEDVGVPNVRQLVVDSLPESAGKFEQLAAKLAERLAIPVEAARPLAHAVLIELSTTHGTVAKRFEKVAPLLTEAVKLSENNRAVEGEVINFHTDLSYTDFRNQERADAWLEKTLPNRPGPTLQSGLDMLWSGRAKCDDEGVVPRALKGNPQLLCHLAGQLHMGAMREHQWPGIALLMESAWRYAKGHPHECAGREDDLARDALAFLLGAGLFQRAVAFYSGLTPAGQDRVLDLTVTDALHRECTVEPRSPQSTLNSLAAAFVLTGDFQSAKLLRDRINVVAQAPADSRKGYWINVRELQAFVALLDAAMGRETGDVFESLAYMAESTHFGLGVGREELLPSRLLAAQLARESYPDLAARMMSTFVASLKATVDPWGVCQAGPIWKGATVARKNEWCRDITHDDFAGVDKQFKLDVAGAKADLRGTLRQLDVSPTPPHHGVRIATEATKACIAEIKTGLDGGSNFDHWDQVFDCALSHDRSQALVRWAYFFGTDDDDIPGTEGAEWATKTKVSWHMTGLWSEHHSR